MDLREIFEMSAIEIGHRLGIEAGCDGAEATEVLKDCLGDARILPAGRKNQIPATWKEITGARLAGLKEEIAMNIARRLQTGWDEEDAVSHLENALKGKKYMGAPNPYIMIVPVKSLTADEIGDPLTL